MGVLTDFFIANDDELNSVCRGWKRPAPLLDEFRTITAVNPFTKEPIVFRTRAAPDQPKADPDAVTNCDYKHLPWIAQKGILSTELALLACVLLAWDYDRAEQEIDSRMLIGPPCEEFVCEVHPALLERLAELSIEDYGRYGAEWSTRYRESAMTIRDERTRDYERSRPDTEWISRLTEIASLAKRAVDEGRSMFMWIST